MILQFLHKICRNYHQILAKFEAKFAENVISRVARAHGGWNQEESQKGCMVWSPTFLDTIHIIESWTSEIKIIQLGPKKKFWYFSLLIYDIVACYRSSHQEFRSDYDIEFAQFFMILTVNMACYSKKIYSRIDGK